jgi:ferrous iron transport protein B
VTGFMAKEIVVSTLSQIYINADESAEVTEPTTFGEDLAGIGVGFVDATVNSGKILLSIIPGVNLVDEDAEAQDTVLSRALRNHFTPLSAAALLVFVLLYVPCVATLGAIKHEFGMSWAVTSAVYQTAVAWVVAVPCVSRRFVVGFWINAHTINLRYSRNNRRFKPVRDQP